VLGRLTIQTTAIFSIALAYFLACDIAFAAPPVVLPGSADPARIIKDNEKIQEPQQVAPPSSVHVQQTESPAPKGSEKVTLVLKGVILEGMTVYSKGQLETIYAPYIGKTVPLSKLFDFAGEITQRYRADGYVLSRAFLPPQKLDGGVVHIQVVEGYVKNIEIEGKVRNSSILTAIIDRLKSYRPLNIRDLERDTLLLSDLAGNTARAVLKAPDAKSDGEPGAVDIALIFSEVPMQSSVSIDNYGSRYVGPYEMGFQTGINHLIMPYQQTTLNGIVSIPEKNMQFIQVAQRMPLNSMGTTATVQFAYAHTQPGYRLESSEVKSDSYNYGVSLSHPLLRSRAENLYVGTGLTLKNIHTDILSSELYTDRLTILNVSTNYDFSDKWAGANLAEIKLNHGLDALGNRKTGSFDLSRPGGHSDFTDVSGNIGRMQSITNTVRVYVAGNAQYSWDPLLSSEQFGFGGQQFGRAYDSSELIGDNGIAGVVELRYSVPELVRTVNSELYTFYDIGRVWNYHNYEKADSAASTGLGVRFNQGEHFSGNMAMAFPLTHQENAPQYGGGNGVRFLGSLSAKF